MTPRSSSSPEAKTNTRKRALTLIIDVKEEVCLPIVKTHHFSEVESSNLLCGEISSSDESCGSNSNSNDNRISNGVEECLTPKAEEYRIPKLMTCPPPPMKRRRRVTSSLHWAAPPSSSAAGFFCPAELELLFLPRHNNIVSRI